MNSGSEWFLIELAPMARGLRRRRSYLVNRSRGCLTPSGPPWKRGHFDQQFLRLAVERAGQSADVHEGDVACTSFHPGHVGPIETAGFCQPLLRQTLCLPEPTYRHAKGRSRVHRATLGLAVDESTDYKSHGGGSIGSP